MKKTLSLFLTLALLMTASCAFAEKHKVDEVSKTFSVEIDIPEGATYEETGFEGWVCVEMSMLSQDGVKMDLDFNITPSEEYDGKSLRDFTDEEKAYLMEQVGMGFYNPVHMFYEMDDGNVMLFTNDDTEDNDTAVMQTIYNGYFMFLYCARDGYSQLSESDIEIMFQIMNSIVITRAE